jgi:hypothetical protein
MIEIQIFKENHRSSEKTPHPAPRSVVGVANLAAGRKQPQDHRIASPVVWSFSVKKEVKRWLIFTSSTKGLQGLARVTMDNSGGRITMAQTGAQILKFRI